MTKIKIVFALFGEAFSSDDITNWIGVTPFKYWEKGERIRSSNRYHENCAWIYHTESYETLFLEDVSHSFLEIFSPKMNDLKEIVNRYNVEPKIEVVSEIEDKEKPSLFLSEDFINFAADLNTSIDIDLYILD